MQLAEVLLLAAVFSCRRLASHGWQQEAKLDEHGDVRMYWTADVKKNVLLVEVSPSYSVTVAYFFVDDNVCCLTISE